MCVVCWLLQTIFISSVRIHLIFPNKNTQLLYTPRSLEYTVCLTVFFFQLFLIEGQLLYCIVLVSAMRQPESAIGIHMSPPPEPTSHPIPLFCKLYFLRLPIGRNLSFHLYVPGVNTIDTKGSPEISNKHMNKIHPRVHIHSVQSLHLECTQYSMHTIIICRSIRRWT